MNNYYFKNLPTKLPGVTSNGSNITSLSVDMNITNILSVGETLIIADEHITSYEPYKAILENLENDFSLIKLNGGEHLKTIAVAEKTLKRFLEINPKNCICIGSGALINLVTYVVALFEKEKSTNIKYIIVPTNTMAIADVSIGGLGMINDVSGIKNVHRAKRDADSIVLYSNFITQENLNLQKEGLIETLKHCILQKTDKFEAILNNYIHDVKPEECFAASILGLSLKADLMRYNQLWSEDVEFLLSYGHLHAHVIEEYWDGKIPHSICVAIGLTLDLMLTSQNILAGKLINSIKNSENIEVFKKILSLKIIKEYLKRYPKQGRFWSENYTYKYLKLNDSNIGNIHKDDNLHTEYGTANLGTIKDCYLRISNQLL